MELKLKTISQDGIAEAIAKAEHYRHLHEPEESESICHDILAVDPENQTALRILGLAITDECSLAGCVRAHLALREARSTLPAAGDFRLIRCPIRVHGHEPEYGPPPRLGEHG